MLLHHNHPKAIPGFVAGFVTGGISAGLFYGAWHIISQGDFTGLAILGILAGTLAGLYFAWAAVRYTGVAIHTIRALIRYNLTLRQALKTAIARSDGYRHSAFDKLNWISPKSRDLITIHESGKTEIAGMLYMLPIISMLFVNEAQKRHKYATMFGHVLNEEYEFKKTFVENILKILPEESNIREFDLMVLTIGMVGANKENRAEKAKEIIARMAEEGRLAELRQLVKDPQAFHRIVSEELEGPIYRVTRDISVYDAMIQMDLPSGVPTLTDSIKAHIESGKKTNYLDAAGGIGCAATEVQIKYGNQGLQSFVVDVNEWKTSDLTEAQKERAIRSGQKRGIENILSRNFSFIKGDIETIQLPEKMDIITCIAVLQYLDNPLQAVINLYNQLNKNGVLFTGITAPKEHEAALQSFMNVLDYLSSLGATVHYQKRFIAEENIYLLGVYILKNNEQSLTLNLRPSEPIATEIVDVDRNLIAKVVYYSGTENIAPLSVQSPQAQRRAPPARNIMQMSSDEILERIPSEGEIANVRRHTLRVARFAARIAEEVDGVSQSDIELVQRAAWSHDIGQLEKYNYPRELQAANKGFHKASLSTADRTEPVLKDLVRWINSETPTKYQIPAKSV